MNAIMEAIEKKRGELVELSVDVLVISEFTTRHACIDEEHVKELAAMITEYGFYPDRGIQVNAIRNAAGDVIAYRVVAGVHRYLGAKLAERYTIYCRLYYDLTDEEECFLDSLDNKLAGVHKRVKKKNRRRSEASYKSIQAKIGGPANLSIDKLVLSEFCTRCFCIDWDHVETLSTRIQERGFFPTRALVVNVVTNTDKEAVAWRVVAGCHRFEAAKKAGLHQVPCFLYYDLTEQEECLMDRWDNEMDEERKKKKGTRS